MQSIHEAAHPVEFDAALRTLAAQARSRYAGEAARIDRGLVIALNGGVTLLPDGMALVRSQSDAEIVYTVNGHCDCPDAARAPSGHCKHVWAKVLHKRALALLAEQQTPPQRYFATYYNPAGEAISGVATYDDTKGLTLFVPDDGGEPLYPAAAALCLGGHVPTYESQRAQDGDLVRKVCGY